jgi:anti-anti-sigma factor
MLVLRGELDMAETAALAEAAASLATEPGDVTLDLHALTFIDSSGLLALLRVADAVHDGNLVLCDPTEQVRMVFELVDLAAVSPRIAIVG